MKQIQRVVYFTECLNIVLKFGFLKKVSIFNSVFINKVEN